MLLARGGWIESGVSLEATVIVEEQEQGSGLVVIPSYILKRNVAMTPMRLKD